MAKLCRIQIAARPMPNVRICWDLSPVLVSQAIKEMESIAQVCLRIVCCCVLMCVCMCVCGGGGTVLLLDLFKF